MPAEGAVTQFMTLCMYYFQRMKGTYTNSCTEGIRRGTTVELMIQLIPVDWLCEFMCVCFLCTCLLSVRVSATVYMSLACQHLFECDLLSVTLTHHSSTHRTPHGRTI